MRAATTCSIFMKREPFTSTEAQSGAAYIQGVVRGGHMQGQIVGDACGYRFEADGTGAW